ncbi:MAG: ABC transporter ATP-binding protein [Candidatus Diapherotrites archaeon]
MAAKQEIVLSGKSLIKTYTIGDSDFNALDGISLDLEQGEFVSIMGPSGSGKTTLLDVLSCLNRPSKGEILIKGKPISEMDDNELAQVRGKTIGFVFQTFNLINRMTAKENVMLPLWFQGLPKAERAKIAEEKLKAVGLENRMNNQPTKMSGGQRQRVAIARALAVDPDIIVADEPTGNLDSASGEQVLEIIDELHKKENKTILMVTHERYVAEHAERIIHLKDGKIVQEEDDNHFKPRKRSKEGYYK